MKKIYAASSNPRPPILIQGLVELIGGALNLDAFGLQGVNAWNNDYR